MYSSQRKRIFGQKLVGMGGRFAAGYSFLDVGCERDSRLGAQEQFNG